MERIANHTRQPGVLREIFAALRNDPFVIAECLARPVLAERLVTELNNEDRVKVTRIAWRKQPLQSWVATAETQVPVKMAAVTANYTLPVIAGPSGGCTDDTWTPTSLTNAPDSRSNHTAVWTGSEMIVWGGNGSCVKRLNSRGRYNPRAVWTGSEMIAWGGGGNGVLNTGGRYNPGTDSWTATNTTNAPDGRAYHTAVWTGSDVIVWGGVGSGPIGLNSGGRYNPSSDSWTATSTSSAPAGRFQHSAVWTGSEMIVWGGNAGQFGGLLNTGGRYNPGTDSWTATSANAPAARRLSHGSVDRQRNHPPGRA